MRSLRRVHYEGRHDACSYGKLLRVSLNFFLSAFAQCDCLLMRCRCDCSVLLVRGAGPTKQNVHLSKNMVNGSVGWGVRQHRERFPSCRGYG